MDQAGPEREYNAYEFNSVISTHIPAGLDSATQEARYGAFMRDAEKTLREFSFEDSGGKSRRYTPETFYQWVENEKYDAALLRMAFSMEYPIVMQFTKYILDYEHRMTTYASSLPRVSPPPYGVDSLTNPSIQALNEMQKSILQRQGHNVHFNQLYRVAKVLGAGKNGVVFGMTMRTPDVDSQVLTILREEHFDGTREEIERGMERLYTFLSDLPKWCALKIANVQDEEDTVREYLVGREVSLALLPLGIRATPAYYTLFGQRASDSAAFVPTLEESMEEFFGEEEAQHRRREDRLYTVAGRPLHSIHEELLIYQEYINGRPWGDVLTEMTLENREVIMCFLHSVLSYLSKQLGYVHGDLHQDNILMMPHSRTVTTKDNEGTLEHQTLPGLLPIIDEDGNVITHLESNYYPVIIDHGSAKTRNLVITGEFTSYASSEIFDIVYLYRGPTSRLTGFGMTKRLLDPEDVDITARRDVPRGENDSLYLYPGATFSAEGKLTHASIVRAILDSGRVNKKIVEDAPAPTPSSALSLYSSEDRTQYPTLAKRAKALLDRYTIGPGKDEYVVRAVRLYLQETAAYYSHSSEPESLSSFFSGMSIR